MTVKILTNISVSCLAYGMASFIECMGGEIGCAIYMQVHVYLEVRACMCMTAAITSFSIKVRNSKALPHP